MTMKRFGTAALLLSAMALAATGCMDKGTSSEGTGTRMSGEEHREKYPEGHDRSVGKNCYYDSETDSFFCTFDEK